MDDHSPNQHQQQFIGMDNTQPTPVVLQSGDQAEPPRFHGLLRQPFPDSTNNQRPSHGFVSQLRPEHAMHAADAEIDDSLFEKASKPGMVPHKKDNRQPLTGRALGDRRRLAAGHITQGGWRADITEMALDYIEQIAWYETSGRVWGVRCFCREAEELGELCSDWQAIRQFLDKNIHKFIAFQAMERDFEVPDFLVRKGNQRRSDGALKYPWLRSFIRECQGMSKTTAESLLQAYKDQSDGFSADEAVVAPAQVLQGRTSGGAIASTPGTMATNLSLGHEGKTTASQTCQMPLDQNAHGRKRQRPLDDSEDLDICDPIKSVKRESSEEGFVESQDMTLEPDTREAVTNGIDDGKEMIHMKGRTLTVLFDGMRHEGDDESELVQVYVPRTSKGVTINFL